MEGKKLTKEELFTSLEEKFPWLRSEDGINYQVSYIYLLFSLYFLRNHTQKENVHYNINKLNQKYE